MWIDLTGGHDGLHLVLLLLCHLHGLVRRLLRQTRAHCLLEEGTEQIDLERSASLPQLQA